MTLKKLTGMMAIGVFALGTTASARAATQGVSADEVVFGMHTALSGPVAGWGVGSVNGIRMRFDEANKNGGVHGRKLRLIVEDNQYQVPQAVQASNKLINRDKIFVMLGALGTPMNNAVMPRMFEKGIPNIFPYTAARSMAHPLHPLKFAATSTYYDQNRIGTKFAVETLGAEKICVLAQDSDFGEETMEAVNDQLKAMGKQLTAQARHKPTDSDFMTALGGLRNAGCEALILGTILRDTILINGTAKRMGWNVPMIGNIASYDKVVSEAQGGATEGYYAVTSFNLAYEHNAEGAAKDWIARYQKIYNELPPASAQLGYISADLVIHALENAGRELTVASFLAGLEKISGYQDIFGGPTLSFGPDKHIGTSASLVSQVKDGHWQPITGSVGY